MSFCLWQAIQFASTVTRQFDFEGSMIQPIERFFRAFGGQQTAYHNVSRTSSMVLRGALALHSLVGRPR